MKLRVALKVRFRHKRDFYAYSNRGTVFRAESRISKTREAKAAERRWNEALFAVGPGRMTCTNQ